MFKTRIIILIVTVFCLPYGVSFSRNVILDDRNVLYLPTPISLSQSEISFSGWSLGAINLNKDSVELYFKFNDASSPSNISISSSFKYIAFMKVGNVNNSSFPERTLIVTDIEKIKRNTVVGNGIYSYAWNPQNEILAYIKGHPDEDFPGFRSKGVFIYDPEEKNTTKIDFAGYDIAWDGSGQKLYMTNFSSVVCFNMTNQKLEKTEHKGIYFSPDNEYYFSKGYEGTPSLLYGSSDDKPVGPINERLQNIWKYYNYQEWLQRDMILADVGDKKYIVINIESNSIISEFQGNYVGSNRSGTKIVINPLREKTIDFGTYQIIDLGQGQ